MTDLTPSLVDELTQLAQTGDVEAFRARAQHVHPSDVADALAAVDDDLRLYLVGHLPPELVGEALAEMEPEERPSQVLEALTDEQAADIVDELSTDDAADVLAELPPDRADTILRLVDDREDIEGLLRYDEDSAGGIMTTEVVVVPQTATAGEAIEAIRRQSEDVEDFYQVYCVDDAGRLVGVLPLHRLVRAAAQAAVQTLMEPAPVVATPELDQEEVARLMSRYNLAALPVVRAEEQTLLGRITFDDVIDVVEAEQTEDLLKFGGVSGDEQLGGGWFAAVRTRLPWLVVNLFTGAVAASVIHLFQDTIDAFLVLAALGPVVAGMGGNAGTQALAVTVRRVALGQVPRERARSVIGKELAVGFVNGLAMAVVVGLGAAWWVDGSWTFGLVVLLAMWGNVMVAGIAGAAIPLVLHRVGYDPAVASSVFLTAFTDVLGYFLILGLASVLIL